MVQQTPVDPADWVTIWQSELAALAVDRESHEIVAALSGAWAAYDLTGGRPGSDAPPGAPAAGIAPGVGGELDELRRRVAELERAARPPA
jgi:hypothetical protein